MKKTCIHLCCGIVAAFSMLCCVPALGGDTLSVDLGGGLQMEFVWVPAGEFEMGSNEGFAAAKPVHRVSFENGFWMGKYEVTQEQWKQVMGTNMSLPQEEKKRWERIAQDTKQDPSQYYGPKKPVDGVSWDDCQKFLKNVNSLTSSSAFAKATADGSMVRFHLPTEAEWEYACRAGTTTRYYSGDSDDDLGHAAWFGGNSGSIPHPVGQKAPNAWGLYDMHGNVKEWCEDPWCMDYADAPSDGSAWGPELTDRPMAHGDLWHDIRIVRGGSWHSSSAAQCLSAVRSSDSRESRTLCQGFRVVARTEQPQEAEPDNAEQDSSQMNMPPPKHAARPKPGEFVDIIVPQSLFGIVPGAERQPEMAGALTVDLGGGVIMGFEWIPPGEFDMGSNEKVPGKQLPEIGFENSPRNYINDFLTYDDHFMKPVHRVRFEKGFWMGKYEVTQEQWKRLMGTIHGPTFLAATNPVDHVNWRDCQKFLSRLNRRPASQNRQLRFRLPSEAEWEYACRAGTTTRFYTGDSDDDLDRAAWFGSNSSANTPHPAGQKAPNAWGLYDMHGNVCELCEDWCHFYHEYYYPDASTDGGAWTAPITLRARIARGGSVGASASDCRSAYRLRIGPDTRHGNVGFRIVGVPR